MKKNLKKLWQFLFYINMNPVSISSLIKEF